MPLGGAGEIGMNAYVYGYGPEGAERLILVDLGVTFPDMDTTPGVDLILPDMTWLRENRKRLEAIFITHAHEDHIGAVSHLWEDLGAPVVHARAFTANILRHKMTEYAHDLRSIVTATPWPERIKAGPFEVAFLPISHSVPESAGLVIDSPEGALIVEPFPRVVGVRLEPAEFRMHNQMTRGKSPNTRIVVKIQECNKNR